jgi:hypothetical protein
MQVTEVQVQRSLEALTTDVGRADRPVESHLDAVPAGLVERLAGASSIRDDRLEDARRRLAEGDQPSAEALAQRMVGRLVCDRLR